MSSSNTPRRQVRPQPPNTGPQMIQPQPPPLQPQYYSPQQQSPYTAQPPQLPHVYSSQQPLLAPQPQPPVQASSPPSRKRKAPGSTPVSELAMGYGDPSGLGEQGNEPVDETMPMPAPKKSRTNTPWTPTEEQRLKVMRDAGNTWGEIAKTFPARTEGSVKKHWYKDMHYADFAEDDDQSAALLAAIKEYEASKWKVIGQKVGKPAKACEQYAKEHFQGRI